jgi:3' terminal RNA ribose 2'-O-methyltransferase Hen1
MLLTIACTTPPATDLGYLLHKNPARFQTFSLSFGKVHVFYPEASEQRCTAALLLEIDPIRLVRRGARQSGHEQTLQEYVNDRPYVSSSFLSVAIASVFGSALSGQSEEKPELAETPLLLEARVTALPCRGGTELVHRLFEPLGYSVSASQRPLDETFPEWGESPYVNVTLRGNVRLKDLLSHLYVLVPVLDDGKHYWVGDDEVDKLLRHGAAWLAGHPERELIAKRYLKHQRRLTRLALARLLDEDLPDPDGTEVARGQEEADIEARINLGEQRIHATVSALKELGAKRVLDLGCGEGRLIKELLADSDFQEIVGMDVSHRALDVAHARLDLDRLPPRLRDRVRLLHGSLIYRDERLTGYDAAVLMEVLEHLDSSRLGAFERVVFEFARPRAVLVTTPNAEYNVRFPNLPAGRFRHRDHRFEWTRAEFSRWASDVAGRLGYSVRFAPIGPDDPEVGPPSQMGVFTR